jgi:hypothetical protein
MATHDYIISNASGAAVRADLNNALAAIATNNSSATEPTTTYAYQWWADTGSSPTVMKLRNAANSAWITLFQLDGEWTNIAFENGTAAAPSIYFKDSGTDTGIYSPGTDQVGISAGGTSRFEVSTTATTSTLPVVHPLGAVGTPSITFTGDLNTGIYSPTADTIAFVEGGVEAMRIDSSSRVGIGTTAPDEKLTVTDGVIRLNSTTSTSKHILFHDTAGIRHVIGSDATAGSNELGIRSEGQIVFGAGSRTEAARIDSSRRLLVGTSTARTNVAGSTAAGYKVQIESFGTDGTGSLSLINNYSAGYPGILAIGKSNGSSVGSNTLVNNGDDIGIINFCGADGTNLVRAASITAFVDGTPGALDMPGRLVFATTIDGGSSPTERMRIRSDGIVFIPAAYGATTASAANVNVAADGALQRSTSSIKYKTDIETLDPQYSEALLDCRPVWYRSTCAADNPGWGWWGFIAEEVAAIDPRLVQWKTVEITHDDKGSVVETPCEPEPEGVAYDRFVPHLLNLIKRQKEQIEAMEARLSALETA